MKEFGIKRANPNASTTGVQFAKCGDKGTICEDVINVAAALVDEVSAFTYDGVEYPIDPAIAVSEFDELEMVIGAEISKKELNTKVNVSHTGTNIIITHEGAFALESVTIDSSEETASRNCTVTYVNKFQGLAGLAVDELIIDGEAFTLTNSPYASYDGTEGAKLKADIEEHLDDEAIDYESVTVTFTDDTFIVQVDSEEYLKLALDTTPLTFCDRYKVYS